jgi:hypothetical protein
MAHENANAINPSGIATLEPPREPWMCTAHLRDGSGRQCRKPRMLGQVVCGSHGGSAPQTMAAARQRIFNEIDPVMAELIAVAKQRSGFCPECGRQADALKLRAMIAVVDRAFDTDEGPQVTVTKGAPAYLAYLTGEELETFAAIIERATGRMRAAFVDGEVVEAE